MHKLTAVQVKEIRERSEPHAVLGREYGVSATTIRHIRFGETWGWL